MIAAAHSLISLCRRRLRLVTLVFASAALATPACGQEFETDWVFVSTPEASGPLRVSKSESTPFGSITASQVIRLSVDVRDGKKSLIPAGTALAWNKLDAQIACEVARRPGKKNFVCLQDRNEDGKFDHYRFISARDTTYYIMSYSKTEYELLIGRFAISAAYVLSSPFDITNTYKDTIEPVEVRISMFKRDSRRFIGPCIYRTTGTSLWGSPSKSSLCSERVSLDEAELPQKYVDSGGSVTLLNFEEGVITLSVTHPPAGAVFGQKSTR